MSERSAKRQREDLLPSTVFCPLNDRQSLVCEGCQFGPVDVECGIIDSEFPSLLLPWPEESKLASLKTDILAGEEASGVACRVSISGAVGQQHATCVISNRSSTFKISIQGVPLAETHELRFCVTAQAVLWLEQVGRIPGLADLPRELIHSDNLSYALIGQTVLSTLLSLQVYNYGLFLLCEGSGVDLNALRDQAAFQATTYKTTPFYQSRLRDLRDHGHEDSSDRRTSVEGVGKRHDFLGLGVRE
eukprot:gnl/Spiro4/3951_TR1969_c0_g1_i1.p1 gnl/Spiro4/3951_TR1969_c0_g1~~gnl/Spiro4/3951_TR1969_c0_g1_i1.p1  ORF type:complete len:246 (+),score=16.79 gnl/Spiro4/3951_TR1969_c0_g1_i1:88-825(+)